MMRCIESRWIDADGGVSSRSRRGLDLQRMCLTVAVQVTSMRNYKVLLKDNLVEMKTSRANAGGGQVKRFRIILTRNQQPRKESMSNRDQSHSQIENEKIETQHLGRRLAAIMFTDIVGFTAMVQRDESLSLVLLEEHDKLLRPIFQRDNGRT